MYSFSKPWKSDVFPDAGDWPGEWAVQQEYQQWCVADYRSSVSVSCITIISSFLCPESLLKGHTHKAKGSHLNLAGCICFESFDCEIEEMHGGENRSSFWKPWIYYRSRAVCCLDYIWKAHTVLMYYLKSTLNDVWIFNRDWKPEHKSVVTFPMKNNPGLNLSGTVYPHAW